MNRFSQNRHRRDANHYDIQEALERCGCSVRDLSQIGGGTDLLVGCCGRDYQVEVKVHDGELSDAQIKYARDWKGQPPIVVRSILEAVQWANEIRCAM